MGRLVPVSRDELIRKMRNLGFDGPFVGGTHQYMEPGNLDVSIPNPHRADIGIGLLASILRQAGIAREDWLNL